MLMSQDVHPEHNRMIIWWLNQASLDALHAKVYGDKYVESGDSHYLDVAQTFAYSWLADIKQLEQM